MATRVYEFSKKYGLTNKEVMEFLRAHNMPVATHMAPLTPEAEAALAQHFVTSPQPQELAPISSIKTVTPDRAPSAVSASARAKKTDARRPMSQAQGGQRSPLGHRPSPQPHAAPVLAQKPAPGVEIKAMTVSDFADASGKPVNDVIVTLLRQGIVAAKNQIINEKVVAQLAAYFGAKVLERAQAPAASERAVRAETQGDQERMPIVVVMGHVDHGKTSLLDYIRKTRVAAREKGGITQHLGAYQAKTDHGSLVFLDTPGHEAFSMMRVRGVKVADIAILVVAADDGIMPQTIEAIKTAQAVSLPIVVAINKIDRVSPAQIETVKRSLAQYDLVPEEWGGKTIVVPISAKVGTGVNELLEMIALQSQMMDLRANPDVPARGYILESRVEKGLGSVATVVCHEGTLRIGDHFASGAVHGRISSLVDSFGKRVQAVGPSIPVQVAGFSDLPRVGDLFEVVEAGEGRRSTQAARSVTPTRTAIREGAFNLIVKTDGVSSQEALLQAIERVSGKSFKGFNIIHSGIGPVTESDVTLAADTNAIVYTLHTKIDANAQSLAQRKEVLIKPFDIIYKLLEDLELLAQQGKPVKKILKKIGEAVVVKVFDIKNMGVIAGAQVTSGRMTKDGRITVYRGRQKIGEGAITSLQRERKNVKEVHNGFDCGVMVQGITDFQVDDRLECSQEIIEALA